MGIEIGKSYSDQSPENPFSDVSGNLLQPDITNSDFLNPQEQGSIEVNLGPNSNISIPDANVRAKKWDYALGEKSPGLSDVYNQIINNNEQSLKDYAATQKDIENQSTTFDMIQKAAVAFNGELTPENFDYLKTLAAPAPGTDPNTVLPKAYSDRVLSDLYHTGPDTGVVAQAQAENPPVANFLYDYQQSQMARQEINKSIREDLGAKWSDLSMMDKVSTQFASNFLPLFSWVNTISHTKDIPDNSFLPGSSIAEKVQALHSLSDEDYARIVPQVIQSIANNNIEDAMKFLQALDSYSLSDQASTNLGGVLDITGVGTELADIAKAVKGLRAAGKFSDAEHLAAQERFNKSVTPEAKAEPTKAEPTKAEPDLVVQVPPPSPAETRLAPAATTEKAEPVPTTEKIVGKDVTPTDTSAKTPSVKKKIAKNPRAELKAATDQTLRDNAQTVHPDVPTMMESAGKTDEASATQAFTQVRNERDFEINQDETLADKYKEDLLKAIPSSMDPQNYFKTSYRLASESTRRITDALKKRTADYFEGLTSRSVVLRMDDSQIAQAVQLAQQDFRHEYPNSSNNIVDTRFIPGDSLSNTNMMEYTLKRNDGTPFETYESAKNFAENEIKLRDKYDIVKNGDGYALAFNRPVRETDHRLQQLPIETGNETTQNVLNNPISYVGAVKNDILSPDQIRARLTVVHGIQKSIQDLQKFLTPVRKLTGSSRRDFERFLSFTRDVVTRDDKGNVIRGLAFKDHGAFERAWQASFNRLPTEKESAAYWTYKQAMDFDWMQRNTLLYRSLSRMGVEDVTVRGKTFHGIFHEGSLSSLKGNPRIAFVEKDKDPQIFRLKDLDNESRKSISDKLEKGGYRIVQIADPYSSPLAEELKNGQFTNFVITKDYERKPISARQVPYNPGVHVKYQEPYFIKQPRISQGTYLGDTTIRPANSEKDAAVFAEKYDNARLLLKAGGDASFDKYVRANLYEKPEDLKKFFKSSLSLDHPITYTKTGGKTLDNSEFASKLGKVYDSRRDPYNAVTNVTGEYLGDRSGNLSALSRGAAEQNPLTPLTNPNLLDPLSVLNRAVANLASNHFLQDYRALSAENYVREFQDIIKTPREVQLANPLAVLMKPDYDPRANVWRRFAAENMRNSVQELLGVRTADEKVIGYVEEKLHDVIHDVLGQKAANVSDAFVSKIDDPVAFSRAIASKLHLGLFNPLQYWKQAQTVASVTAIGKGKAVMKSWPMYAFVQAVRASNNSENMVNYFDKLSRTFGWKEGDFALFYKNFRASGLGIVKGDHTYNNALVAPKLFQSSIGKMMDKSSFFFEEGERTHRIYSAAVAFQEWRDKNPLKTLTTRDWQNIVMRADDLTQNMTKASQASYNRGLLSVPFQFANYQWNTWQQIINGRLTFAERAKLLGVTSALYGIPIAGGSFVGIWPFYEDIRQGMLEKGQDYSNEFTYALHKGLVSSLVHMITGKEYDVGESYGQGGLSQIKDALYSDKGFVDIMTGVAGSTLSDLAKTAMPVYHDALQMLDGTGSRALMLHDISNFARNASSYNQVVNVWNAYTLGKYITKNDQTLDDNMDQYDAIMEALGVHKSDINDAHLQFISEKEQKDNQNKERQNFINNIQKYWKAVSDDEDDTVQMSYWQAAQMAFVRGDFRPDELTSLIAQAGGQNPSMVDSVNQKFLFKAPASQAPDRFNRYLQKGQ